MIRAVAVAFAATLIAVCVSVGCGTSGQQKATPMEITSASVLPGGRVNMSYSVTLGVSGGVAPFTWAASGSPPSGLTLDSTGKISGTPTQSGSFTFFATVTDSSRNRASQSIVLSLTVAQPIQITPVTLPSTSPGVMYNATLNANGGTPPYTWSITNGSLPAGLTLNASTGAIAGISMTAGAFTFGVGVVDASSNLPPVTTTLSIAVFPAPPRNAVLYGAFLGISGEVAKVASDGSLSDGGPAGFNGPGGVMVTSTTLPLLFGVYKNQSGGAEIHSLLINPDYTATLVAITNVTSTSYSFLLAVDPTGANLYVTGNVIEDPSSPGQALPGVAIYTANAYPQAVGTLTLSEAASNLVFTPDGTKAFMATCGYPTGSILEFSRAPTGILTTGPTQQLSECPGSLAVSPDGKYLATTEIQIYQIAGDGSLSSILPSPFTATFGNPYSGQPICPFGTIWDTTGNYLLVGANCSSYFGPGGIAVMSFAGGSLTQTYYPSESFGFDLYPQQLRSFVYGYATTNRPDFQGTEGYELQNGSLVRLFPPTPGGALLPLAIY